MTEAESIAFDRLIRHAEIECENENAAHAADAILRHTLRNNTPVVILRDRAITEEQLMKPSLPNWWVFRDPAARYVVVTLCTAILFACALVLIDHFWL